MTTPFKLKYKNSAFPFKDEKTTIKKMKIHPEAPDEPLYDKLKKLSEFKEKEEEKDYKVPKRIIETDIDKVKV